MRIYDNVCTVLRHNYETKKEYLSAYRVAEKHYGFKVRVDGGWKFFQFETDLKTWKGQK